MRKPYSDLYARVLRDKARRRAERVALLRAAGGRPRPFRAPCGGHLAAFTIVVHRDTYEATAGRWRSTRFDEHGPSGHDVFASWSEAVEDAQMHWQVELTLAVDLKVAATTENP